MIGSTQFGAGNDYSVYINSSTEAQIGIGAAAVAGKGIYTTRPILLDNATGIQWKNAAGNVQTMLSFSSGNVFTIAGGDAQAAVNILGQGGGSNLYINSVTGNVGIASTSPWGLLSWSGLQPRPIS